MPHAPGLLRTLGEDLDAVVARDPSLTGRWEAFGHTGLSAVWAHRVAHRLYGRGLRTAARVVARIARRRTGVEIHPGAVLGRRVFIDHGASVVIGQTAVVGDDVTIYQQVTLGAVGWWADNHRPSGARRHPVIGDGVILGANATVLGPVTIGDHVLIGAMATVTEDLPPGTRVYAAPSVVRPPSAPRPVPDPVGSAAAPTGSPPVPVPDAVRVLASAGSW
ncbi:serine O-acetyltransferase EpsC [Streptomyces viridosporus]|uniref:serine O-acetyltransferase n=1 Tax=Streptomyces viridosporus (strain ATCC 14672 / DSM 40746 / JCM 4963 / KCTC 9882 / NRRL B-12104 / FH 1290) TaxID=566461 RepID=D6AAA0_STRV1|nr:serine O-acetyltransferase EpsC [Streptomyces viridosporus]EFE72435.1 serine O-acetyltransferase [Streptomyces viridosporus ATCC 14672]